MHNNSLKIMEKFIGWHLKGGENVLDIGSKDVNGTLKELFTKQFYTGADIEPGGNVDIIIKPYDFGNMQFDVVVSANCLEHVQNPFEWVKALDRVLKPGGLVCITTPVNAGIHRFPVDCWRIMPDGYAFLFKDYQIIYNEIYYGDSFFIARKRDNSDSTVTTH